VPLRRRHRVCEWLVVVVMVVTDVVCGVCARIGRRALRVSTGAADGVV
jgi:hypothetical protein